MKKNNILIITIILFIINCSYSQDRNSNIDKYLLNLVANNQLDNKDILEYKISNKTISKKSNIEHYYFTQSHLGIEIIGTESSLHVKDNKILSSNNKFIHNKSTKITFNKSATKTPLNIINSLSNIMNYNVKKPFIEKKKYSNTIENKYLFSNGGISKKDIPIKKVFFITKEGQVKIAWKTSIYEISGENWWNFIIDDATSQILLKNNWITSCNILSHDHTVLNKSLKKNNTINVTNKSLTIPNSYNVFGYPLENPNHGDRSIEVNPQNTNASPFGWHDINGVVGAEYTVTNGNNVSAFENGDNVNFQPDGGEDLIFDFSFDPVFSSNNQSESAAITNLFYWNNFAHDVLFEYGFDEESGNFQVNNYSNLGLSSDAVLASSQDNSGTCNALFGTPPDGQNGVMIMMTCNDRDSSFDNHVIIHEFAHGISNRLTGGPSNSDCLYNNEQMGEGWSDWYANMLTMKPEDLPSDLRGVGTWLFGEDKNGRGIRDFPYTTDLSQDPRTYNYVKNSNSSHATGSIWAAMLWEVTWKLIDKHGFDSDLYNGNGGNNIALNLITEGLKLQPCSPGFVDGRDAILAADRALYNGKNQCIIWDAFAKRGLGINASQGSSFDTTDGVESFDSLSTTFNIVEKSFCELEESISLSGGYPEGGIYSGTGITDSGDGKTYTFNPQIAGIGKHIITYTVDTDCNNNDSATDTIEVTDKTPTISCKNFTTSLNENNTATIEPQNIVEGFLSSNEYLIKTDGIFSPEDISAIETKVNLFDDQVSTSIPIGFNFDFFGLEYSNFYISSNGFITFNNNTDSGCCSGQNLPNQSAPNNLIAFAWTDLFPNSTNYMSYAAIGTAPNRILIINSNGIITSNNTKIISQIKIYENSNLIEIHSANVSGSNLTQGIENIDGTNAYFIEGRNANTFSLTNDYIAFVPTAGILPNDCGSENTVTIDKNTFDCNNVGENIVTATVTDSSGNSSTCQSIVTILPFVEIEFNLSETTFCQDQTVITSLRGGIPEGGIYSGNGVTDDGDGTSFSFNPSELEIGNQTIFYEFTNSCGTSNKAELEIEITPAIPDIFCQDISVELDINGTVTISPEQLILSSNFGDLYVLNALVDPTNNTNINKFSYDTSSDNLEIDTSFSRNSSFSVSYSLDYNPINNEYYILAQNETNNIRSLYSYNIKDSNSNPILIDEIISVEGNTEAFEMTFDKNGNLYFIFVNGEINQYNIQTKTISSFSNTGFQFTQSRPGLSYDFDKHKLIYSHSNSLFALDIQSITHTPLFNFTTNNSCNAEGLEYVGDNKLIVSSVGCGEIYTINIETEEIKTILNPTNLFSYIIDLVYISSIPVDNCNGQPLTLSLSKTTFDCNDVGGNAITLTATDTDGNTSTCISNITILDFNKIELNLSETTFCKGETDISGLTGGIPEGGVYSGNGVIDDGNGSSFSLNTSELEIGNQTIFYEFTNSCELSIKTEVQIEILPAIPDILCKDISVELDSNGTVIITPEQVLFESNNIDNLYTSSIYQSFNNSLLVDNCNGEPLTLSLNKTTFDCNNLGENTIILTATDTNGNSSTCTSNITIIDSKAPELITQDDYTLDLDAAGNGTILLQNVLISGEDNCDTDISYTLSKTTFTCEEIEIGFQSEDINLISNGSFENDLNNWNSRVNPEGIPTGSCTLPWLAAENSLEVCCCVDDIFPTNASKAAYTSFDSNVENTTYTLEQNLLLPNTINNKADLSFDWLGEFDLLNFGATRDRLFYVTITDETDNVISTIYEYSIPAGQHSSINNTINIDISSIIEPYLGQIIKLKFNAFIEQQSSGPSKSLIDNVKLMTKGGNEKQYILTTIATDNFGNSSNAETIVNFSDSSKNCTVLSVNSFEDLRNKITISPIPAKDILKVSWVETEVTEIKIYDLNGRFIKKVNLSGYSGSKNILISDISSGVYLIKFINNNITTTKKFIKSK